MTITEHAPLADRTTLGVGGPARYLVRVQEAEVPQAVAWCDSQGLPWMVLGAGSNLLVSDAGWPGAMLQLSGSEPVEAEPGVLEGAAGASWDELVQFSVGLGWAGLECLSGIPGTVGATPVQNVGAYGQEVAAVIERVRAWDGAERRWVEWAAAECGFGYRASRFNGADRGRFVITRVQFRLRPGGDGTLVYPELRAQFEGGAAPTLAEVREAVLRLRRRKSMVLDGGDPDSRSAGSFFKNPVVSAVQADAIAATAGSEPPRYPAAGGEVKIPAAWLLEQAGFHQGFALPGSHAALSRRHVLAIVNRGGASAAEVLALARAIQQGVAERFGVRLEPEPERIGFEPAR